MKKSVAKRQRPSVAIRTDASTHIATGHVVRCLALASKLREKGCHVRFVCRHGPMDMIEVIAGSGFEVSRLPPLEELCGPTAASYSWERDAEETQDALADDRWDWLVVDHYDLDARWEARLGAMAQRIMAIDDMANRPHLCDLLLDQNLHIEPEARYQGIVPPGCVTLFGPRFALLRDEFVVARNGLRARSGDVERILVSYGGVDLTNETEKALAALALLSQEQVVIDVLTGLSRVGVDRTFERYVKRGSVCLIVNPASVATLMASADLALGGGGATTWERCCLRLPSIVTAVGDNQIAIAESLAEAGAAVYMGAASTVTVDDIASAVQRLSDEPRLCLAMGEAAGDLVDGLGASRVCSEMVRMEPMP